MGTNNRNVSGTMPKIDFSALKTADLRSAAPVAESPAPQVSEAAASVAVPVFAPVAAVSPVAAAVAAPVASSASVSARTSSVKPVSSKRISLTKLKSGEPSVVEAAPVAESPAPQVSEAAASVAAVSPAVSLSDRKPKFSLASPVSAPVAETVEEKLPEPAVTEGVDFVEAAKVLGSEAEAVITKMLSEDAGSDVASLVEAAVNKKPLVETEAVSEAVSETPVQLPEREFFPNLGAEEDEFFQDPIFEGIVPVLAKEKKADAVAEAVPDAPAEAPKAEEPVAGTLSETIGTASVSEQVSETSATEPEETPVLATETAPAVSETEVSATDVPASETVSETPPVESVFANGVAASSEVPDPQYVEAVARDLSSERKGGLAKLFGERQTLVRTVAGCFVLGLGAASYAFLSPELKTSAPESVANPPVTAVADPAAATGAATVAPSTDPMADETPSDTGSAVSEIQKPVYRVIQIRRPNIRKKTAGATVAPESVANPPVTAVADPAAATGAATVAPSADPAAAAATGAALPAAGPMPDVALSGAVSAPADPAAASLSGSPAAAPLPVPSENVP